jgi:hypothetical protein
VRIYFVAGITLALFAAACSSPRASSSAGQFTSCVNGAAAHHAYVVVQHMSGGSLQRCVGFDGSEIDGQALMDQSGIQYASHQLSHGKAVCQVDNEPQQFTQCFPQNQPYWALFIESNDKWTSAPGGFTDTKLHDAEALGWHYVSANESSPAPPPLPLLKGATS